MCEIEVGCKISDAGGLEGFGEGEVADLLARGWRVVSVTSQGAILREMPATGGERKVGFVGFAVLVRLEEPGA